MKKRKYIPATLVILTVATLLVFCGLIMLSNAIDTNNEFWINLAPELFGAGIWIFVMFVTLTALSIFGIIKVKKKIYT